MHKKKSLAVFALVSILLIAAPDAFAADARVTATGKFVFSNPETRMPAGIRRARIEMCDEDGWGVCSVFATGETADDGNFTLTGTSGDWFGDLPEVEVRVYATSPGVEVYNGTSVYCFKTATHQNATNGMTIMFGDISPQNGRKCTFGESASGENGAWATYQWARETFDFLRGAAAPAVFSGLAGIPGSGVSRQKVKWPAGASMIYGDFSGFDLKTGEESPAARVIELYTLVAVTRRLGTWHEGQNDLDCCFTRTFSGIIARHFGHRWETMCLVAEPTLCGTPEDPPHLSHEIGGMTPGVAAIGIYWDLYDPASGGDHDWNGSSDQLALSLDVLWSILRDFDPSPGDSTHNHPRDVQEFGRGVVAKFPASVMQVRDVFDENHLAMP